MDYPFFPMVNSLPMGVAYYACRLRLIAMPRIVFAVKGSEHRRAKSVWDTESKFFLPECFIGK